MRQNETLTNEQYVPRILELQAQGAGYWTVKVLHGGYEISYALPSVPPQEETLLPLDIQ